ncbi:MAG: FAD-dependent oxidoreductase, partial [Lachnospiraceae bacterium]|nr:FAD-dependent oxidoreductase [Lachnospiraceae bacterium]
VGKIPFGQVITAFSGLRAHEDGGEFILGEPADAPGFFDAAGIESPGLTSAPAIGQYLADLTAEKGRLIRKKTWKAERSGIRKVSELSDEARALLINEHPEYGVIVCRCENISEGEMIEAIRRPIGARSLDGLKRRVRQGAGRCQAGFCMPRAVEILARELEVPEEEICKNNRESQVISGR